MEITEGELVRRAQAGDTNAFAALVNQHQRFVYNLALRSLGDAREAEDVAQEAFVRAWQALPNFRQHAQFRTWLYRIVFNLCCTHLPRLRRDLSALDADECTEIEAEPGADPARGVELAERRAYLHAQIERLPESYRVLVLLRYQQELSYEEIASIVGTPIGTVKTGLFRARERLRQALQEYEEGRGTRGRAISLALALEGMSR